MNEDRRIDKPRPGWFAMKLVKGGPRVPCRISFDETTRLWSAEIDGAVSTNADPTLAGVFRIWLFAMEIEEWVFLNMVDAKARWAVENPDHPCLHPRRRIEPMLMRPPAMPKAL